MTAANGRRLRYMEIAEDLRQRIRDGQVGPDGRVGTFGSLEEDYGAAKGTIDKALGVLRQEGTVVTIAGKGIFSVGGSRPEEENATLRERVTELEAQVAELREAYAVLQAQMISLHHSVGRPHPRDKSTPRRQEEAG